MTFNDLASEWEMAGAFVCRCGADRRFGDIRGSRHPSRPQQDLLAPQVTPFLRRLRARTLPSAA